MKDKLDSRLKLVLTAFLILITIKFNAQEQKKIESTVFPINEAIEKNLVEIKITGASDPRIFHEVIDGDGLHFGKCMAIILKSHIDSLVKLRIECGTELMPFDTTFQTMIVTKSIELPLYPNTTYTTRFYAMCGQINDDPPYSESIYSIGELADSNTVKLAKYFDENHIQNMVGQHALWAYTDGAEFKNLEKYGADSLTIKLTKNILKNLAIPTKLYAETPLEVIPEKIIDNTIEVNKLIVYGTCGVVFLLLITTISLLIRRRKNDGFDA